MNHSNKPLRILVVDDSAVSRRLAACTLVRTPYEVSLGESGEQALHFVRNHHPDVVITDWQMPGMSGLDLCRTIREKLHCRETYLILLTSSSSERSIAEARAAGTDGHLVKPLDPDELFAQLSTTRGVLRTRRQLTADNTAY